MSQSGPTAGIHSSSFVFELYIDGISEAGLLKVGHLGHSG